MGYNNCFFYMKYVIVCRIKQYELIFELFKCQHFYRMISIQLELLLLTRYYCFLHFVFNLSFNNVNCHY